MKGGDVGNEEVLISREEAAEEVYMSIREEIDIQEDGSVVTEEMTRDLEQKFEE